MSRVRVNCFSVSLDGFGAGPNQSLENPLGERGPELHNWFFPTRTFQTTVLDQKDGATGVDNDMAVRGFENVGAWILGRNMFAHSRGPWPENDPWQGWWGDSPPYHCDVFVLTHHPRASFTLDDTAFHFITDGIESALARAKAAAKGKDVRIGGGASTIRQYLKAGLIDEMHLAVSPVVLGKGEPLMTGLDLPSLGFSNVKLIAGENTSHYVLSK